MSALEKAKQQPMLSATSRAMNRFILRLVSAGSAPPPAAATHRRAARSQARARLHQKPRVVCSFGASSGAAA